MFKCMHTQKVPNNTTVYDNEEAIDIWWIKPHVANRRLAGCLDLLTFDIDYGKEPVESCVNYIHSKLIGDVPYPKAYDGIQKVEEIINDATNQNMELLRKVTNPVNKNDLQTGEDDTFADEVRNLGNYTGKDQKALENISGNTRKNIISDKNHISTVLKRFKKELKATLLSFLTFFCLDKGHATTNQQVKCRVRKLLPRSTDFFNVTYEMMFSKADCRINAIMFIPLCCDESEILLTDYSYMFRLNKDEHRIDLLLYEESESYLNVNTKSTKTSDENKSTTIESSPESITQQSYPPLLKTTKQPLVATPTWLSNTLLVKLAAWTEAASLSDSGLRKDQSLSLLDIEAYSVKYIELKKKYGPHFVEIWPESTDALKFVYEDIGIAAYLLVLWEKERHESGVLKKQTFVDLGCGNGLLVHILTSEGHEGRGIDINRRKIWDLYGPSTVLQEKSIIPNELVVEEDWIIGNHSDELTPWIPIIALKSSHQTRYFVLPCCFFDFYCKFQHINQKKSHYDCYLEYIREVGEKCGFDVCQDTLRIPSTKRVCQVGIGRSYEANVAQTIERILLNAQCKQSPTTANEDFKPRASKQVVRNCSHINEHTSLKIVNTVAQALLSAESLNEKNDMQNICKDADRRTSRGYPWTEWNQGGRLHLNDVIQLFHAVTLKQLKFQCGGMQTLMKNNRNIFKVVGGFVQLRDYRNAEDLKPSQKSSTKKGQSCAKRNRLKTKLCWFHESHPQGCLYNAVECSYAHGTAEMRTIGDGFHQI